METIITDIEKLEKQVKEKYEEYDALREQLRKLTDQKNENLIKEYNEKYAGKYYKEIIDQDALAEGSMIFIKRFDSPDTCICNSLVLVAWKTNKNIYVDTDYAMHFDPETYEEITKDEYDGYVEKIIGIINELK